MTLPAPLPSTFDARLAVASTPAQTKELESISAAARAYYREQQDYEGLVKSVAAYFMSRRKTTELIRAEGGNSDVTAYKGYGFTKMQWHRRMKELQVETERATAYFSECIAHGWNPSIAGVLSFDVEKMDDMIDPYDRDCLRLCNLARDMRDRHILTVQQIAVLDAVLKEFAE